MLEDFPRRVRISDAHQSGFIAAAVLLSVLGSVAIALRPEALSGVGWYVVAATAVTSILRARVWDSAACKAWLLVQPYLVAGVLLVLYAATGRYGAALGAVLVLSALMLVWVAVALNPGIASPESYSLPARRLLGFVAAGLDGSLIRSWPIWSVSSAGYSIDDSGRISLLHSGFGCCGVDLSAGIRSQSAGGRPGRAIARRNPGTRAADGAARPVQYLRRHPRYRSGCGDTQSGDAESSCGVAVFPGRRPVVASSTPGAPSAAAQRRARWRLCGDDRRPDRLRRAWTLVAGIIAGQPAPWWWLLGSPRGAVLSLRVTSAKFSPRTPGGDPTMARASFDVATLARAIVHAADLGARVINISAVTCLPADRPVDQAGLGAAIRYAAVDKDAVIVAAAGNTGATGSVGGGTSCESNPLTDLGRPNDPRNWASVTSVSIPSWWQPYVLSAAS